MKIFAFVASLLIGIGAFFFRNNAPVPTPPEPIKNVQLADCSKDTGMAKIIGLADNFKATLSDALLAKLQLTYSVSDAQKWSNFPEFRPTRVGVRLGALNTAQLAAAKALMATVMGQSDNEGFDEWQGALAADDYFGQETGKKQLFNSGNFFIAFLGKPSATELWELQCGGHHFAFGNTYKSGKLIGATPSFRGVEPEQSIEMNGRIYQPLAQEHAAFSKILAVLSETERNSAKLSTNFRDILLGPNKDGQFPNVKQGIKIGTLASAQQAAIIEAIKLYVNDLDATTANQIMAKYTTELPDTYLAYSGSGTMNNGGDYIRLDGASLWIEYSAQPSRDFPNTAHPHSVWRDRQSDYGGNQ
jgi:Protein of unknown function (DUF3500)